MPTATKYKYALEQHPAPKSDCPQCRGKKSFRHYVDVAKQYGICDHVNSCGYKNAPKGVEPEQTIKVEQTPIKTIYPTDSFCKATITNQTSNFHAFCFDVLTIAPEHLNKWNCGTIKDKTAFVYQNLKQQFINIVHILYSENGKRIKEALPFSLPIPKEKRSTEKYSLCLFGEHLLTDKTYENRAESDINRSRLGSYSAFFFKLIKNKLIFAIQLKSSCGCGVIGSRARLRIWCREAWGFESLHPHLKKP